MRRGLRGGGGVDRVKGWGVRSEVVVEGGWGGWLAASPQRYTRTHTKRERGDTSHDCCTQGEGLRGVVGGTAFAHQLTKRVQDFKEKL